MTGPATRAPRIRDGEAEFAREGASWRLVHEFDGELLRVLEVEGEPPTGGHLLASVDALRARSEVERVRLREEVARRASVDTRSWTHRDGSLELDVSALLQLREPWLDARLLPIAPEVRTEADCPGGWHPRRPRVPPGHLYSKRLAATGQRFTFRRADLETDGDRFHRWQNRDHVARAWNEQGSREEHDAYLRRRLADPHIEPLVGAVDGEPFAYVEVYWAREDRIGPHCDPGPYDQGLHLLVGEPSFLGGALTAAWMRATFHFMFLREPRTTRLVGEPDAGNGRVLRRLRETGWRKRREFDFPHKRAALVTLDRHAFFGRQRP